MQQQWLLGILGFDQRGKLGRINGGERRVVRRNWRHHVWYELHVWHGLDQRSGNLGSQHGIVCRDWNLVRHELNRGLHGLHERRIHERFGPKRCRIDRPDEQRSLRFERFELGWLGEHRRRDDRKRIGRGLGLRRSHERHPRDHW
jgi:hypothetical protein